MKKSLLCIGIFIFLTNPAYPDSLTLENGEKIEGIILEEDEASIKFKEYLMGAGYAISNYQKSRITNIARWTEEENERLIEKYERLQKERQEKQKEITPATPSQPMQSRPEIAKESTPSQPEPRRDELFEKRKALMEKQVQEMEERENRRQEMGQERKERFEERQKPKEAGQELYNRQVTPGMSEKQVRHAWGTPSYTTIPATDEEIWIYDTEYEGKYSVHFVRGSVTEIIRE